MEDLILDGLVAGCLDLTTTELADEVAGGLYAAGADRCRAAPLAGIPTLLVPGCVDMIGFNAFDTIPARLRDRTIYEWNPDTHLVRSDPDENRRIGEMLAAAANSATGPVAMMLPLKGVSMLDSQGADFWDPDADLECFDAIRRNLNADVPLHEIDCNIAAPEFARAVADVFVDLLAKAVAAPKPPAGA